MKETIVMVSGCFDLLHAGHVAFFKSASRFGKLHVYVGRDENIRLLKGKLPVFTQQERKFMVESVKYVNQAHIASGMGMLDFEEDLKILKPDIFVVNHDGFTPEKRELCMENNVELLVLDRIPEDGLPARSSSDIKRKMAFPYRICLAGGWIDQPWMSEIHQGAVVVAQIAPDYEFNDRSGMATSSRKVAVELWRNDLPAGDPVRNARHLFGAENPPGSNYISGSQDHIGLLVPGISRLRYNGGYWPSEIETLNDPETCQWLSKVLNLIPMKPRPEGYDPLLIKNLNHAAVKRLGESGEKCFHAIAAKDIQLLGESMRETLFAWRELLPETVPEWVMKEVELNYLNQFSGAVTSGSGGGYLIVPSEKVINGAIKIKVTG